MSVLRNTKRRPRNQAPKRADDSFEKIATLLSKNSTPKLELPERIPVAEIVPLFMKYDEEEAKEGLKILCKNISEIEDLIKTGQNDYLGKVDLKENTSALSKAACRFTMKTIVEILESTNSMHVCLSILNSRVRDDIKEAAEKRLSEIDYFRAA